MQPARHEVGAEERQQFPRQEEHETGRAHARFVLPDEAERRDDSDEGDRGEGRRDRADERRRPGRRLDRAVGTEPCDHRRRHQEPQDGARRAREDRFENSFEPDARGTPAANGEHPRVDASGGEREDACRRHHPERDGESRQEEHLDRALHRRDALIDDANDTRHRTQERGRRELPRSVEQPTAAREDVAQRRASRSELIGEVIRERGQPVRLVERERRVGPDGCHDREPRARRPELRRQRDQLRPIDQDRLRRRGQSGHG